MISLKGGPCGHYNPFMKEVLRHCGFDSKLVPAWMKGKLSHMAINVRIEENNWWLDFGNGHPYLTPILIGSDSTHTHAGLTYRIRANSDGKFTLEHLLPDDMSFSENYIFATEGVPFSFFDEMVQLHYTKPDFGPFLQGIRFIRFPEGEMLAVRDHQLLRTVNGKMKKEIIEDISKMEQIIDASFQQATYPLRNGLGVLGWS
jgi:arylamine N-acetyltransferase